MGMRVGELARRTGVGVSTLRAWETRYAFLEPQRSPAGHRMYDEADVERVNAVHRLVGEGLTLAAAIARVASIGTVAPPAGEAEALLYGQILQAVGQGIWVIWNGRTRYANRRMAEIMGYSVEDLVALPVLEIFDPQVLPSVRERAERVRAGHRVHFTQELRRADGSTFVADVHTTPLFNQAGRYEGAVALVSDVTARNEAATQARLRATLLDSIGEAVAAATPDEKVVYVNPAAERLFGWRVSEAIGRNGRELLTAPEASDEAARIHSSLLAGTRHSGTLTMSRRDGTRFPGHLTSSPVLDEQGTLIGLVAVITDQGEHDQRDRDLQTRERQAETLALLGTQALRQRMHPPAAVTLVLTEVVDATRRLLDADQATVLDVTSGSNELHVNIASPPIEELMVLPTGSRSFAGYVALAGKVVVVDDTRNDRRFDTCETAGTVPVASAIGAPIFGPDGIVGVLTAERSTPQSFDRFDMHFIQGMANVIGTALLD
jgi:PAS domain S-box-containing protein